MSIDILLADDCELWRRFVYSMVEKQPGLKIICEVSDGLAAVHKANELKPDLILLDIGLPSLDGIEAARRIQEVSPASNIVFLTANNSWDTVQEALSTSARGFVHKQRADCGLLPAIDAAVRGGRSATRRLKVQECIGIRTDAFHIFAGIADRDATWLETVLGLREVRERMREIAAQSRGAYFIFHAPSRAILEELDTTLAGKSGRRPSTPSAA